MGYEGLIGATTSTNSAAAASPFVLAVETGNIEALSGVIDVDLVLSVLNFAASDIYIASRTWQKIDEPWQSLPSQTLAEFLQDFVAGPALFIRISHPMSFHTPFPSGLCLVSSIGINLLVRYSGFLRTGREAQGVSRAEIPRHGPLPPYDVNLASFMTNLLVVFNGLDVFIQGFQFKSFVVSSIDIVFGGACSTSSLYTESNLVLSKKSFR
ncbi:uncharacterized protein BDV17DRAFT_296267 [Aspergillus undulatus]|uniref:uncharacterized protein n=1 Tax=Aspergillus undulatus TaxID=1810928 RepID=UPI003CCE36A8